MSDRLNELQRQRALAQEQLAWLDREIARESGGPAPASVTPTVAAPGVVVAPNRSVGQPTAPSAEEILAQYQSRGRPMHEEARRGCIIYFIAAMTMLVLGLCAFLMLKYK